MIKFLDDFRRSVFNRRKRTNNQNRNRNQNIGTLGKTNLLINQQAIWLSKYEYIICISNNDYRILYYPVWDFDIN